MKAMKSEFAKSILRDPKSAHALERALTKAGYYPRNGVVITVRPMRKDGTLEEPVKVNVHYVPIA